MYSNRKSYNLIFSFILFHLFWVSIWILGPTKIHVDKNQIFTFGNVKLTHSVYSLDSKELEQWTLEHGVFEDVQIATAVILDTFCGLDEPHRGAAIDCCGNRLSMNRSILVACLRRMSNIGTLPVARTIDLGSRDLPESPAPYSFSPEYIAKQSNLSSVNRIFCPVNDVMRLRMYKLLLNWIHIAEEHHLVWWLHYGSLLGSVRHGDFIPYDRDVDLAVLVTDAAQIRNLSSRGLDKLPGEANRPFLSTRPRGHCSKGFGSRLNCKRFPVRKQLDSCAFCGPLARLIGGNFIFVDLYPVYPQLVLNNESDYTSVHFGLFDEGLDATDVSRISYPLERVFPLNTCSYMGLQLPCPRDAHHVLRYTYGDHYMNPLKMCDPISGKWQTQNPDG